MSIKVHNVHENRSRYVIIGKLVHIGIKTKLVLSLFEKKCASIGGSHKRYTDIYIMYTKSHVIQISVYRCISVYQCISVSPPDILSLPSSSEITLHIYIYINTFLDLKLTTDSNHIKSCAHFDAQIHAIIFYSHPVIHLHANNPFHFHKCCESDVVALTMMSLRSQIKSRITFLLANTPSISLNQPAKMFAQFSERIFLSHLLRRFLRIAFL